MSKRSNPFSGPMYVDVKDLPELAHQRFGATLEVLPSAPTTQDEPSSQCDESRTEPLRFLLPTRTPNSNLRSRSPRLLMIHCSTPRPLPGFWQYRSNV